MECKKVTIVTRSCCCITRSCRCTISGGLLRWSKAEPNESQECGECTLECLECREFHGPLTDGKSFQEQQALAAFKSQTLANLFVESKDGLSEATSEAAPVSSGAHGAGEWVGVVDEVPK